MKRNHSSSAGYWGGLAFLTLAVLTSIVDTSVMTVSTPAITRDFGANLADVEWSSTIYSLFFGATMLLWGKLGGTFGHRRLFVAGNLVFAVGSALVGLSPNIAVMIAMRAVQGMGAAMVNPAAIALIALSFRGKDRAFAFGINGVAASIGVALGFVVGGVCAQYVGWRWAFFVNVPLCLISALGVWYFLPAAVEEKEKRRLHLDIPGSAQSLVGLGLAIFALSEGHTFGWWQPRLPWSIFSASMPLSPIPIALVLGLAMLILFVRRELSLTRHGVEPVFDVSLFALASFRWGGVVALLRTLAMFTMNYSVTLYLQLYEGIPALHAAMISFPNALAGLLGAVVSGWLSNRLGATRSVQPARCKPA
jgi:MFS family permease